jgi:hypothetical protein
MGTTALRSGPCPHCGGELEWKATVGNPEKGAETHFFQYGRKEVRIAASFDKVEAARARPPPCICWAKTTDEPAITTVPAPTNTAFHMTVSSVQRAMPGGNECRLGADASMTHNFCAQVFVCLKKSDWHSCYSFVVSILFSQHFRQEYRGGKSR